MPRPAILAFSASLCLLVLAAPLFAGTQDDAKLSLHVKSKITKTSLLCVSESAGGHLPDQTPCSDHVPRGDVLTSYDVFFVIARGSAAAGIAGTSFGIEYGTDMGIFDWILCADLQFATATWPASGTSNRITWDKIVNCQTGSIGADGVHAIAGSFYVYAYAADTLQITPNFNVQAGPELRVADCNGAETELLGTAAGFAAFTPGGTEAGCNPCISPCVIEETCSLSPSSFDFGQVVIGQLFVEPFTLTNTSTEPISGAISGVCTDFRIVGDNTYSLDPGDSADFFLEFAPTTPGLKTCNFNAGCSSLFAEGVAVDQCLVQPTTLDFGAVALGESSLRSFTITNRSTFSNLVIQVDENCTEFTLLQRGPFVLNPGESRVFEVLFEPVLLGTRTCEVDASCLPVLCSGVGISSSVCDITPSSLDFGDVSVGDFADLSLTIRNTGSTVLTGFLQATCPEFSVVQGGGNYSLAPDETLEAIVRYAPVTIGLDLCAIQTEACGDVPASGNAVSSCVVAPTQIVYPATYVGETRDETVVILNEGSVPFSGIVSLFSRDKDDNLCTDFSIVSGEGPYTLGAGESVEVVVRAAPTSETTAVCFLDTGAACAPVQLEVQGLNPCVVSPENLDFGPVTLGEFKDLSFGIFNQGNLPLSGNVAPSGCNDFSIVSGAGPYTLAAGESLSVVIRGEPTSTLTQFCDILTGAPCSDVYVQMRGVEPCEVDPGALNFGDVQVGTFADRSFTITNFGSDPLPINVELEPCMDFAIVSGGGARTLQPATGVEVTVRFQPTQASFRSCTVSTGSNCANVFLTGTGTVGPPADTHAKIAIHLQQHMFPGNLSCVPQDEGGNAPTSTPCSQFDVSGEVLTPYDAYLIVANADSTSGIAGAQLGIEYGPGVSVFGWTLCGDLEFPNASWPASGAGNTLTWDRVNNCQRSTVAGFEQEGVHAIAGFFYVYAYAADLMQVTPNNNLVSGPKLRIADCSSTESDVPQWQVGIASFSSITSGCNPCLQPCDTDSVGGCISVPALVDFGTREVGTVEVRTAVVRNDTPLRQDIFVQENCDEFEILTGGGLVLLDPGAEHQVEIEFAPTTTGLKECVIETGNGACEDIHARGNVISFDGENNNAQIALHLVPYSAGPDALTCLPAEEGGMAPTDLPCSQYQVEGSSLTSYNLYLVVARGNPDVGVAGMACGIQYSPNVGVFDWTLCADLQFPGNNWPASGGGNVITWTASNNCQQQTVPGYPWEGVHAITGAFYVYAYGNGGFTVTPREYVAVPDLQVADCSARVTDVRPDWVSLVGFDQFGTNICAVTVPVELLSFSAARVDGGAQISWETAGSPTDVLGFHIHRESDAGERVRISQDLLRVQRTGSFTDPDPPVGEARYWLAELGRDGAVHWHGPAVLDVAPLKPGLTLLGNAPNPFRSQTYFRIALGTGGPVAIQVFDALGREVAVAYRGVLGAGDHEIPWDGRGTHGRTLEAGIYLYRVVSAEGSASGKLVRVQ